MQSTQLESRKQEEIAFHNKLRDASLRENKQDFDKLTSNRKYYSVAQSSKEFFESWLIAHCNGKRVLDYGCGDAPFSFLAAKHGAEVTGVDISDVSVENCKKIALEKGLEQKTQFHVMDCEALDFPDATFDVIFVAGVLHHLDLDRAFRELRRVLKPEGVIIAYEALAHNPLIHLYRRMTPQLRTEFETNHILKVGSLKLAKKYFKSVRPHFFHLFVLLAVPFRNSRAFPPILRVLEAIDAAILRLPILRRNAWMMIFTLSKPTGPEIS